MTTKLTLTVEENVIRRAKLYAKQTGRSLSELIENYLDMLTKEDINKEPLSPKLKSIAGIVKLPKDFNEKEALEAYFREKHL